MGYYDRNEKMAEVLKERYPKGTRVKLIEMEDEQAPPVGTLGTVMHVDDMATVHVKWDTGSTLGCVLDVDRFEKVNGGKVK